MKRILFPTDFSDTANNAFVHALAFAKKMQGELILLHTFDMPVFDNQFFPENYMVIYDSVQLAQFEMFKEEIPKLRAIAEEHHYADIKLSHRLMDGDLVFNIEKSIVDDKIDFVIMGTAGATGWSEVFLGTNTGNVLTHISVPLLSVPATSIYKPIENIGFTTRYRPKDKEALRKVLSIAKRLNAKVKCLYVKTSDSDVHSDTMKIWETEFMGEPVTFSVLHTDEVKEAILDFILYKDIDLLTMLTYKRGFFEGIFNPSFTKKFTNSVDMPLLTLHAEE